MASGILSDPERIRLLFKRDPRVPVPGWVFEEIARTGALLEGHFVDLDGYHSQYYLRFHQIGWDRSANDRIAQLLLDRRSFPSGAKILCLESAGLFLGEAIAHRAKAPLVVCETDVTKRPTGVLRDGELRAGDRVVAVSDIVARGRSLGSLLDLADGMSARTDAVLAFASIVPEALMEILKKRQLDGNWILDATWPFSTSESCELCRSGEEPRPGFQFA